MANGVSSNGGNAADDVICEVSPLVSYAGEVNVSACRHVMSAHTYARYIECIGLRIFSGQLLLENNLIWQFCKLASCRIVLNMYQSKFVCFPGFIWACEWKEIYGSSATLQWRWATPKSYTTLLTTTFFIVNLAFSLNSICTVIFCCWILIFYCSILLVNCTFLVRMFHNYVNMA